ncbi:glucosidase [Ferruginibacter lapsinanis]|uniref:MGH1-like glycoside hydrolase domain-containing protein n=1 Tax=Ferruginibacter lapsinanis TaxID=563172 RepID=UPI001E3364DF|nr:glucosidase [Ferruginibacter lapsinanis]UEG50580.1 glucosidase [Ferruginibacter lapsinanis]
MRPTNISAEQERLNENALKPIPLEKWGPYLSERQWGTVREDYSEGGDAWNYFPHDHAKSRAYRWGEDGLAGISDYFQNLCFAVALWNGKDPILKERLYGLTNGEGNHGEDVKELYYYLDNVPTHYYMKYLYKYPQAAFPYEELKSNNQHRSKHDVEFELLDTDVFKENKYFDVFVEYAKNNSDDIFIKIEIVNRGKVAAPITVLPTLWFYNRWQYSSKARQKPNIEFLNSNAVKTTHEKLGSQYLYFQQPDDLFFTENETNKEKLFGKPNDTPFVKDAFHEAIINGKRVKEVREKKQGTKCAPVFNRTIKGGHSETIYLRLANQLFDAPFAEGFENIFVQRKNEADEFYHSILPKETSEDLFNIQRQAFAGLLWSKQFYHYDVERWINTSDGITPLSDQRLNGRNHNWKYLKNQDIIIMPDKWEYPWYAAWDSAFHCIAMSIIDPCFAKNQLILLTREWYMNPSGQIPAYEWNFSDVNPPVHAFAALQVYHREKEMKGVGDVQFLKRIFQKLIINFTWWINRKDENGNNIFGGGFLGLDNIGVFNRSIDEHHDDVSLEQADGTSWMGMYALNMMDIALEIAMTDNSFEDAATKFYEHFVIIAEALNELGLWNKDDNFFYDVLSLRDQHPVPLKVRSIVGIAPLFAVSIIDRKSLATLSDFRKRTNWFDNYRINNNLFLPNEETSDGNDQLLSLVLKERLVEILDKLLDEKEFLSKGGIRALSKFHLDNPYSISLKDTNYSIQYDPGDSTSDLFGGNSNWRGPVWMPINYLIIKAIKKYGEFYGDTLKVEYPKGSGNFINLKEVATELTQRILHIFEKDKKGNRPVNGSYNWFYHHPENKDLILFYEYFHGDTSSGLGASHQTGWTAVLVDLIRSI